MRTYNEQNNGKKRNQNNTSPMRNAWKMSGTRNVYIIPIILKKLYYKDIKTFFKIIIIMSRLVSLL